MATSVVVVAPASQELIQLMMSQTKIYLMWVKLKILALKPSKGGCEKHCTKG